MSSAVALPTSANSPSLLPITPFCQPLPISINHFFLQCPSTFSSNVYISSSNVGRIRSNQHEDTEDYEVERSKDTTEEQDKVIGDELLVNQVNTTSGTGSSFLAKAVIFVGLAATATILLTCFKQPNQGTSLGIQYLADGSSSSTFISPDVGFTFKTFGYKFVLPEYALGWIYFWLLMAAGCGLFISEEAFCPMYWYLCTQMQVGTSLARRLILDGAWPSFAESFSRNAPYIISTVLRVYW